MEGPSGAGGEPTERVLWVGCGSFHLMEEWELERIGGDLIRAPHIAVLVLFVLTLDDLNLGLEVTKRVYISSLPHLTLDCFLVKDRADKKRDEPEIHQM
jgi:hypothetical protein